MVIAATEFWVESPGTGVLRSAELPDPVAVTLSVDVTTYRPNGSVSG